MAEAPASTPIRVEFSGGMELLFKNQALLDVVLTGKSPTIAELLAVLRDEYLKERPELFMQGESIRPGVLILINEVDWELEGGLGCVLKPNDAVLFISTLHGG